MADGEKVPVVLRDREEVTGRDETETTSELLSDVEPSGSFDGRIDGASVLVKGRIVPSPLLDGRVWIIIPVEECLELGGPATVLLGELCGAVA